MHVYQSISKPLNCSLDERVTLPKSSQYVVMQFFPEVPYN